TTAAPRGPGPERRNRAGRVAIWSASGSRWAPRPPDFDFSWCGVRCRVLAHLAQPEFDVLVSRRRTFDRPDDLLADLSPTANDALVVDAECDSNAESYSSFVYVPS